MYSVEELYCDPKKRRSSGDTFTFLIQKMKQQSGTVNTENWEVSTFFEQKAVLSS